MPGRVDLLASVREVRVFAAGLRAAAGKMLGGAGDAGAPDRTLLQAFQLGQRQLGDQLGILAEGALNQETMVIGDLDLAALMEARASGTVRPLQDSRQSAAFAANLDVIAL